MERKEKMAEMLKPLGKEKSEVMSQLLESVSTAKLEGFFNKYLPHVMADKAVCQSKENYFLSLQATRQEHKGKMLT
jgi:hypothetical protein